MVRTPSYVLQNYAFRQIFRIMDSKAPLEKKTMAKRFDIFFPIPTTTNSVKELNNYWYQMCKELKFPYFANATLTEESHLPSEYEFKAIGSSTVEKLSNAKNIRQRKRKVPEGFREEDQPPIKKFLKPKATTSNESNREGSFSDDE
jgi:hypothetical protein